ncbi:spore germination protein [Ammoniphilus sp. CFH 90114]|uniref:spore germination protein n=1 Tax=Ammoniphilus sp. CFH 90114 TaxID=2493665 RepID=UPI00100F0FA8|nr:spore germination protein [Ammoniphilus sp. CFH 90114]RXT04873.1 spore germination protein [Ammoniphilus sp. CFH 90114]
MFGLFRRNKTRIQQQRNSKNGSHEFPNTIFSSVQQNVDNIRKIMSSPDDLITRVFTIANTNHACAVICIDGLVDKDLINDKIIRNIQLQVTQLDNPISLSASKILQELENAVVSVGEITKASTLDDVMYAILSGDTVLFVDGTAEVLIVGGKGWASRGVEEPVTEALVRGPRDGFTENLRTNTAHIRRHLRDPNLRFESFKVGRRSKKTLVLCYVDGIVNPALVKEARRRIQSIDLDDVPESGYIEQWIEDSFLSPFPQIQHTERPDKVAAGIVQGRIALILDGSPFALVMPMTLASSMQSPEDHYERWLIGTLLRVLRYGAAFLATFLPALYVALVSYHPGMIPSKLAFSIAGTREGVPFPAVVEAIIMEVTLELLREAGIRLPKPIGQTIGIVGGLVIGEAAVSAGIVSPVMVIVVAVTAISSFAMPAYSSAIALRMLRFPIVLAASIFGLYGVILCYIMINIHIANLKSFGIPYSTPFAPNFLNDWKDLVIRAPLTMLGKRPQMLQTEDKDRMYQGGRKK